MPKQKEQGQVSVKLHSWIQLESKCAGGTARVCGAQDGGWYCNTVCPLVAGDLVHCYHVFCHGTQEGPLSAPVR